MSSDVASKEKLSEPTPLINESGSCVSYHLSPEGFPFTFILEEVDFSVTTKSSFSSGGTHFEVLASRRPVALIKPAIKLTCLRTPVAPARTTPTRNEQVSGFLEDCGDEGLGRIYFGSEASAITAGDAGVRKSVANAERDKR